MNGRRTQVRGRRLPPPTATVRTAFAPSPLSPEQRQRVFALLFPPLAVAVADPAPRAAVAAT